MVCDCDDHDDLKRCRYGCELVTCDCEPPLPIENATKFGAAGAGTSWLPLTTMSVESPLSLEQQGTKVPVVFLLSTRLSER